MVKRLQVVLIVVMFASSLLVLSWQKANRQLLPTLPISSESTAEVIDVPVDTSMYEPSRYGIPDTLGGYKVLAVISSENNGCYPAGVLIAVLQVSDSSSNIADLFPRITKPLSIREDIAALGIPNLRWRIAEADHTKESIIRLNELWGRGAHNGNCPKLGGPIDDDVSTVIPPPTPIP